MLLLIATYISKETLLLKKLTALLEYPDLLLQNICKERGAWPSCPSISTAHVCIYVIICITLFLSNVDILLKLLINTGQILTKMKMAISHGKNTRTEHLGN